MRAIRVKRHGDPSALELDEVPRPAPAPGQALVKVVCAGVNYADVYQRRATGRLPFVPGLEGAGVIEALGPGVQGFREGDRVAWGTVPGSYAEHVAADASKLIPLPAGLSFEAGAAFPLQGMTAHYLVHELGGIGRGDVVLVHAAAGGVGLLVVQWAKRLGARVLGTASTPEKCAIARDAGADETIRYGDRDWAREVRALTGGAGADVILDGVGRATFVGDLRAVRRRGRIVLFGGSSGTATPISPHVLMRGSITVSGASLGDYTRSRDELLRRAGDVLRALREEWLDVRVTGEFPLAEAAKAHELLEGRKTTGKLVLVT